MARCPPHEMESSYAPDILNEVLIRVLFFCDYICSLIPMCCGLQLMGRLQLLHANLISSIISSTIISPAVARLCAHVVLKEISA